MLDLLYIPENVDLLCWGGGIERKKDYIVDVEDFRIFRLISFKNPRIKILHFCNEQIMTK